jgi:hypothetical protein
MYDEDAVEGASTGDVKPHGSESRGESDLYLYRRSGTNEYERSLQYDTSTESHACIARLYTAYTQRALLYRSCIIANIK